LPIVIDLGVVGSGRGSARAEDAQGTPTQSHIKSPSIQVYEDYLPHEDAGVAARIHRARRPPLAPVHLVPCLGSGFRV